MDLGVRREGCPLPLPALPAELGAMGCGYWWERGCCPRARDPHLHAHVGKERGGTTLLEELGLGPGAVLRPRLSVDRSTHQHQEVTGDLVSAPFGCGKHFRESWKSQVCDSPSFEAQSGGMERWVQAGDPGVGWDRSRHRPAPEGQGENTAII